MRTRPNREFQSYLSKTPDPFTLNLRGKTLMEIIEIAIKVRSKRYHKYGKHLSSLVTNIKLLEETYHTTLKPNQVTDIFWDYFIAFCSERGLMPSTIGTVANQLRAVLNWSVRYNAEVSSTYCDLRIPKVYCHEIALTADDVSRIRYFDIDRFYAGRRSDYRATMHKVRDMFVLSCNLYQRHSDMLRISKECFDRNIFRITQQKTGNLAVVDINKYSIDPKTTYEILERYNYEAPYKCDASLYDRRLHTLMRDIGFTELIRVEQRVGGQMVAKNIPKWKMISSHTARRTATTIGVIRGNNIHSLKRCTGHSDLRCLDSYIRDE